MVGFFAFMAVVVTLSIVYGQKQAKVLGEVYAQLAERFGGTADRGDWMRRPTARFVHNGANVLVDVYSTGGKHPQYYTQVHVTWPDKTLRCEVYPANFFSKVGNYLGMADVEIGAKEFDEEYQISGHDPEAMKAFLSPGVQNAINDLRAFAGNGEIYVLVSGGTLLVKKHGFYREFDQLSRYVVLALELYEQAILTSSRGVEFIDQPQPGVGPPICQVCGEAIEADPVLCRACKTPHHKDCWSYYGACSTYGCGEKRFTLSRGDSARRRAS